MNWLRGALLGALTLAAIVFVLGFVGFAHRVSEAGQPDPAPEAEAIVTLTGGSTARLVTGVRLLREGRGRRLLISGVNPDVQDQELFALLDVDPALARCCIDLGRAAEDTLGNASETAAWARSNGFRKLILITDDYHMPRSYAELRIALPEAEIIAYPVETRFAEGNAWRSDLGAAARIGGEYVKYLTIRAREALIALAEDDALASEGPARP